MTLALPDPLVDDFCSRSLFTDFSEKQLTALARNLLDLHGPAYPRVTPADLISVLSRMSARDFATAVWREMEITPKKLRGSSDGIGARDLAAKNIRRAIEQEDYDTLLSLLDTIQGTWGFLLVAMAVNRAKTDRARLLLVIQTRLLDTLADEGRLAHP